MLKEFIDEKFEAGEEKDIVLQGARSYIKVWAKKDFDRAKKLEEELEEKEMSGVMKEVLDI